MSEMKKSLTIRNLKPLSINSTYYGTGSGFTKTSHAREWTREVFFQLDQDSNKKAMEELRQHFEPGQHCYAVNLTAFYPESEMFTKKGHISARTHDLSNWEKSIIDCIFLDKYYNQSVPDGCENLQTDDKYIVDLFSRKRPSSDGKYLIAIEIEILALKVVDNVGEGAV